MQDEPLLRKKDVAQWLNVSERTVNRWLDKGLKAYRINGFILRFRKSEVQQFLETHQEVHKK